jgi:hypothetical protein
VRWLLLKDLQILRRSPLLVALLLAYGGLVGALLALPIAAVVRETVVYLRRHLVLESWGTTGPEVLAAQTPALPSGGDAEPEEEREEVPSRT